MTLVVGKCSSKITVYKTLAINSFKFLPDMQYQCRKVFNELFRKVSAVYCCYICIIFKQLCDNKSLVIHYSHSCRCINE